MDFLLLAQHLGKQIAACALPGGLTMIELAQRVGANRQKLAEIEKGTLTAPMIYYARVIACMGPGSQGVPARHLVFESRLKF